MLGAHWPPAAVDFVFDDDVFVVGNPSARSVTAALGAALRPFPENEPRRGLYRPLTALSYGLDSTLWGRDARGFAVSSALLYLLVVLSAWGFLGRQLPSAPAAFAAALLFAVHPVHTEAVDGIAGRSELLALLCSLLALHAFERSLAPPAGAGPAAARAGGWLWPGLSALAYGLGCAAKETAVVLPAILAAHAAVHRLEGRPGGGRRAPRLLLPHLAVLGLYLAARWQALGGFTPARAVLRGADPGTRLATMGAVFAEYLRLLVFPAPLQPDGYYLARVGTPHALTARSAAGWLALAALLLAAFLAARHLARRRAAGAAATPPGCTAQGALLRGLALLLLFLLPVSHLLPMGALMAERFLFSPSLGFLLALAAALLLPGRGPAGWRPLPRALGAALVGALVLLGARQSRARALEWRDAVRLWDAADRAAPGDVRVQTNLAAELMRRGDLDRAERVLVAALAARPDAVRPAVNLALLALRRGQPARADALYEGVLAREPSNADALVGRAEIAARDGERDRAAALLSRARPFAAGRADLAGRVDALDRELAR